MPKGYKQPSTQSQVSPQQLDGSNRAESDFVYESCCSVATKEYQMGRHVSPEAVPLTVAELARTTYAVPTTVEDLTK